MIDCQSNDIRLFAHIFYETVRLQRSLNSNQKSHMDIVHYSYFSEVELIIIKMKKESKSWYRFCIHYSQSIKILSVKFELYSEA